MFSLLNLNIPQRTLLLVSRSEHSAVTFVQQSLTFLPVIPPVNFLTTFLPLLDQGARGVQSCPAGWPGGRGDSGGGSGGGGGGGGGGEPGSLFRFTLAAVRM